MEGVLKGQISQILLSLHLLQTSPGLISAIFVAVSSMSISRDLVMGFPFGQRCPKTRWFVLELFEIDGIGPAIITFGLFFSRSAHREPVTRIGMGRGDDHGGGERLNQPPGFLGRLNFDVGQFVLLSITQFYSVSNASFL